MFPNDLPLFFNRDEFAVEALIQGKIIKGLEGKTYLTANQVNGCKHTLTCAEADIPLVAPGDKVVIYHQEYQIVEARADGTGLLTFTLERLS